MAAQAEVAVAVEEPGAQQPRGRRHQGPISSDQSELVRLWRIILKATVAEQRGKLAHAARKQQHAGSGTTLHI
jgi:hypothetical protein